MGGRSGRRHSAEPPDPIARAVALHADAVRLREAGEHRVALAAARRAVELFRRHEGRAHPDVAAALLEVGAALELHDRWAEALRQYEEAERLLARYARSRNPEVRRLRIKADRALAGVLRALGRYADAERHALRAITQATAWFGARDLDLAGALNDLGMLRKYQGRHDEAPPLYRRALAILRAAGLGETSDAASLYHNLGGIEHARGHFARAEAPARRAVALRVRGLGPHHPVVAADVAALAAIVERRGRFAEAARLYQRALGILGRVFGPRSYEVGVNLAGLAGVNLARGRHADAEDGYRRALAIHKRLFGANRVEVALTLNDLAVLLAARGRQAEALRLGRRALATFHAACGPEHPHTQACAANIARFRA
jgi:tetratricopeptide (TPR) repeat protein